MQAYSLRDFKRNNMKAINLKAEYLVNPIGIDIKNPRLMWNCEGGKKQTAYRIIAVSDGKTVWDSGKVQSSSMRAEYPLPPEITGSIKGGATPSTVSRKILPPSVL